MRSILERLRYALCAKFVLKIIGVVCAMCGLRYVNSLCWVCVGKFLGKKITPTLLGRGYSLGLVKQPSRYS